jgi:hypothetical protein
MKKIFKGTKQKWALNRAQKKEVNSYNGIAIADCSISLMIDDAEKEANAMLISKAPDLLEFAMFISSHEKGSAPSVGYFEKMIEKAESILDHILEKLC